MLGWSMPGYISASATESWTVQVIPQRNYTQLPLMGNAPQACQVEAPTLTFSLAWSLSALPSREYIAQLSCTKSSWLLLGEMPLSRTAMSTSLQASSRSCMISVPVQENPSLKLLRAAGCRHKGRQDFPRHQAGRSFPHGIPLHEGVHAGERQCCSLPMDMLCTSACLSIYLPSE